jgi:hypothetical protein
MSGEATRCRGDIGPEGDDLMGDVTNVVRDDPARSRVEGEIGSVSARTGDLGPSGFLALLGVLDRDPSGSGLV